MSVDLGIGTTLAIFQASGKHPEDSDRLNRRVRLGVTEVAASCIRDVLQAIVRCWSSMIIIDNHAHWLRDHVGVRERTIF